MTVPEELLHQLRNAEAYDSDGRNAHEMCLPGFGPVTMQRVTDAVPDATTRTPADAQPVKNTKTYVFGRRIDAEQIDQRTGPEHKL